MKSGRLNLLENSRSVQACNGTALPLVLSLHTLINVPITKFHGAPASENLEDKQRWTGGDMTKLKGAVRKNELVGYF
jgi:hypothetical protein